MLNNSVLKGENKTSRDVLAEKRAVHAFEFTLEVPVGISTPVCDLSGSLPFPNKEKATLPCCL